MPKLGERLPEALKFIHCPNCGGLPTLPEPVMYNEIPRLQTELICEICGADLVRNPFPPHGPTWSLREGSAVPRDDGTWFERSQLRHERERIKESMRIDRVVTARIDRMKCPQCTVPVETNGGRRLHKASAESLIESVHCQACAAPLRRRKGLTEPTFPGERFGFNHPWELAKS